MNRLRSSSAIALLAALALIGSGTAKEGQIAGGAGAGGLGFSAQAAWLGGSVSAPKTGGVRAQVVAVNSTPAPRALGTERGMRETLRSEVARARAMQPDDTVQPVLAEVTEPAAADDGSGPGQHSGRGGGARVSWTERYELGPGDSLNFGLYGQAELTKSMVPVAPDWTISYLQAKQVSVRGLTVEELRGRITEALSEFHRNPKVIVTPAKLGSKKFTVLGKVKVNDTYQLDRPTSLLEAIAMARGIVVGVRHSSATELADLKRSFVVRDGEKLAVDLERLYAGGDMTQNIQVEPGDYIYIASNVHNEAYVFGSVAQQGTLPLTGRLSVMGAIAESGGYAKHAWKQRVLLVRGSVGSPEATVIDTRAILRGKETDHLLEPGDIVYVHREPWAYAEEILDIAIKSYIEAATAVAIQGDDAVSIGL